MLNFILFLTKVGRIKPTVCIIPPTFHWLCDFYHIVIRGIMESGMECVKL